MINAGLPLCFKITKNRVYLSLVWLIANSVLSSNWLSLFFTCRCPYICLFLEAAADCVRNITSCAAPGRISADDRYNMMIITTLMDKRSSISVLPLFYFKSLRCQSLIVTSNLEPFSWVKETRWLLMVRPRVLGVVLDNVGVAFLISLAIKGDC